MPSRTKGDVRSNAHTSTNKRTSNIDHLAEWLLAHCPFTALTVLTLLVTASLADVPRPMALAAIMPLADVALNLIRRRRETPRHTSRAAARTTPLATPRVTV